MPTGAVFLSYASEDAAAAERICASLRAAGIEVWFDQSELRGGDAWDAAIRKQIKGCALFMPVISRNAHARIEGYFRLEWKLAVDRSHLLAPDQAFLMPVVIDDTSQTDERIPDRFRELQWSRLSAGEATPQFIERVSRLLSPERAHVETAPLRATGAPLVATPSSGPETSWRSRPVLLMVVAAAVAAGGYFALERLVLPKRMAGAHASAAVTETIAASSAAPEKSIAVLPFTDMSEKHDQEYFGDGMAEEILDVLVKIPDVKVIGRTSSFQFKGRADDLRKIGAALGAAYVVEGSVRRSGNHIRVSAQLIDARDGTHRWSQTYDREVDDALKVQDEIAAGLVRALQLEVTSSSTLHGRALPRTSEAYDIYLRGLHALNRWDQPGFDEAVADFKHVLKLDPTFAPAAEQLARALCDQSSWGFVPPRVGFEQARVAADAALKLDPKSALAHTILGCVHLWYDWVWPAAQQELRTAVTLEPDNPTALVFAAEERMAVGQWAEALNLSDAAIAIDPLLATIYQNNCWTYLRAGQFAEAEKAARRVLEISPTYVSGHRDLGIALLMEGRTEAALAEMRKETPLGGQSAGLAAAYQALRRTKEANAELLRLATEHSTDMAVWIAEIYALRGQKDQALSWLARAYAQKDILLWTIKGDPLLKNLEGDPRYQAFLRKMKLPD